MCEWLPTFVSCSVTKAWSETIAIVGTHIEKTLGQRWPANKGAPELPLSPSWAVWVSCPALILMTSSWVWRLFSLAHCTLESSEAMDFQSGEDGTLPLLLFLPFHSLGHKELSPRGSIVPRERLWCGFVCSWICLLYLEGSLVRSKWGPPRWPRQQVEFLSQHVWSLLTKARRCLVTSWPSERLLISRTLYL